MHPSLVTLQKGSAIRGHESREANNEYKRMCNVVRKAAREDKEKWLTYKCREIQRAADHNKSRKTYKMINEVNGKWKPQQRAGKNRDGALLQDDREIRRRWTEYCSNLYNNTETHERSSVRVVGGVGGVGPPLLWSRPPLLIAISTPGGVDITPFALQTCRSHKQQA